MSARCAELAGLPALLTAELVQLSVNTYLASRLALALRLVFYATAVNIVATVYTSIMIYLCRFVSMYVLT